VEPRKKADWGGHQEEGKNGRGEKRPGVHRPDKKMGVAYPKGAVIKKKYRRNGTP